MHTHAQNLVVNLNTHTNSEFPRVRRWHQSSELELGLWFLNGNHPERISHSVTVSKRPAGVSVLVKTDLTGICSLLCSATLNSARAQLEERHTHTHTHRHAHIKQLTDDTQKTNSKSYSNTHWRQKYRYGGRQMERQTNRWVWGQRGGQTEPRTYKSLWRLS